MLEYNWTRLLNKCMYAVATYFFLLFQYLTNYTFFFKKKRLRLFKLYQALFTSKKLAADDDAYLGLGWSKI